ncbi:hypothetical protein CMUS01_16344, partial [Colletotrichum musicola]
GTGSNATTSKALDRGEIAENLRLCKDITEAVLGLETGHALKTTEICDVYSRPRVSPTLILQRINKENLKNTPMEWRERIADYGDDPAALENELRNPGHTNWTPLKYPDTLLLEVDSDMMVREVQESIAAKMRDPPSGKNAVMQLNMGEGKSAVIVPIVAAALADGSALARVVLGGLVGRRVFKNTLLLLRGLVALNILSFVFCQKQWKVDYGLDPDRKPATRLAVPCRAKDNPSACSEFSHPEVIITLTSLSYYYGSLTDDPLRLTFGHLLRTDQADMEYHVWCAEQVFPCFRYAKGTVDYFLAHIVFPKELKEFPHKLSASGWDIGEKKPRPTTGFSGTNDSRAFLPLTVDQLDDKGQQHTNALVLEYLLQDETSVVLMPKRKTAGQTDAETLLEMVNRLEPPARVILDVGAQILELDNLGVARRWLEMTDDDRENTQAVIFCDENDRLCVVDRRGRVESFQTYPFAGQTDVCLVFLDEAHTRGTDLKLPASYRAAVTLGAGLTKDRLVQACMRMRKLGKGQSVTFCVPDEIQQKIRSRSKETGGEIAVLDILVWAISETFTDLRRGIWLWANQGRRHQEHSILWKEAQESGTTELDTAYAARFLEEEAQTLESRYKPKPFVEVKTEENSGLTTRTSPDPITERLLELEGLDQDSATFHEERELSPEMEQEREIQRPPPATPETHSLHPDLLRFPLGIGHVTDQFQRSVQWILTSASGAGVIEMAVVISPFEAQQLLAEIKKSSFVSLHLYSPRPNMGFRPLDGLDLYTVPCRGASPRPALSLVTQLNLFAGQLYLKSMEEYRSTRRFLQLCDENENGEGGSKEQRDSDAPGVCDEALVQFLKVVMTKLRRDCESIDKTHVGRILDQGVLGPGDFGEAEIEVTSILTMTITDDSDNDDDGRRRWTTTTDDNDDDEQQGL